MKIGQSIFFIAVALVALTAGVTKEFTVDCVGACPTSYRITQTLPAPAGAPAQDPEIQCAMGDILKFNMAADTASHPFIIKTVAGAGNANGVTFSTPTVPVPGPGSMSIVCNNNFCAFPGQTLFYQCTAHGGMTGRIVMTTPCTPVPSPAPAPAAPKAETLCQKYSRITNKTQVKLMTDLVSAIVAAEVANPKIKPFFDGTAPPNSINFLNNTAQFNRLAGGLISFFGAALGCIDPTFPRYTGPKDLQKVHQFMPLGGEEFKIFNDIFIQTLGASGVTAPDQAAIRALLDSFYDVIVQPKAICPKYAKVVTGGNQTALMYAIVQAVVTAELGEPTIKIYFDGTKPVGSKNIAGTPSLAQKLIDDLVAFFGAALGCRDATFPKFAGNGDMRDLHKFMGIDRKDFDKFNDIFITTLGTLGVDTFDRTTIRRVLDSFAPPIVRIELICPKYANAVTAGNQTALMFAVVDAVLGKELGDPTVKPFFDGTLPPKKDFTAPNNIFISKLRLDLVAFFGEALGCTQATFPKFTGNRDMVALHKAMPISGQIFDNFNNAFIAAVAGAGVTAFDQATIRLALESFRNQIVNPTYVCPKYAKALGVSQVQLMNAIVGAVVQAELMDPALKVFFDGTKPPGSTDFTASQSDFQRLANGLVTFFGRALGCTDPANVKKRFPPYTGKEDMKALHNPMGIGLVEFTKFNDIFINTLANLGVDSTDQALIRAVLDSFQGVIVQSSEGMGGDPELIRKGYTLFQPLDCGIVVYWKPVDTAAGTVSFATQRRTDGFIGTGFTDGSFSMVGSDAVIGWAGTDGFSVMPYTLGGKSVGAITPNPALAISDATAEEVDGVTTIYFTRTLDSGAHPITDITAVTMIASTLDGFDGLGYHSCRVSQAYIVNLVTGNSTAGASRVANPQKDAHGALMMAGWGVFLVLGLIVAGYGRDIFKEGLWFKIHQGLQTFGLICVTAGWVISYTMVQGAFYQTVYHAQLGTAIMVLAYFQFLSGVLRPHLVPDQEKSLPRKIFEIQHPWTGRILLIAATVNIFTGINLWWPFWVNIIYAVIVATFALIAVIGEFLRQTKGKADDGDASYKAM